MVVSTGGPTFSLVRVSTPRHAVRRERRRIMRHPATVIVAAPLVTAGIVAADTLDLTAAPRAVVTASSSSTPPRNQWSPPVARLSEPPVTTTGTVASTPVTTATTNTTVHIVPTTTASRSADAVPPTTDRRTSPVRLAVAPVHKAPPVHKTPPVHKAPAPVTAAPVPHTPRTIPLGDYAGDGDPAGIAQFASTTGTHPTLAGDYLIMTNGWDAMDGADGSESWMLSQWHGTGYRLVLGVPIIPDGTGATLAQGATGAYNQYFTTLAQTLVAGGQANAILRLGWEFNGNWYPWSVANDTDAANFAAYWRQIVDTMRAVPGAQFSFLWNPNNGSSSPGWNLDLAYPGSSYVDYVGSDVYDEYWGSPFTPQASWSNAVNQTWGLNWLVNFAAAEDRPIAIPEWSVATRSDGAGLGDDSYFIDQFADWITTHNVAFTCMFSYNATSAGQDDDITDGSFPNALAAFRSTFG